MSNSWFRLYHEFATDPKVQMMSEVNQRRLVMLFCMRCCNGHETFQDDEVTFQLRISDAEWQETKSLFIDKGFIDKSNKVLKWDKRQFVSDSSTARVRKFRELNKTTKKKKRECNVSVTPPEQNRTDTEIYSSDVPYRDIVAYLNEKSNKQFRHTTKQTKSAIKARWNEGFRLDDFKRVIDTKCAKWATDEKMVDYLRPQTLFGTKFEAYLNECGPKERRVVYEDIPGCDFSEYTK